MSDMGERTEAEVGNGEREGRAGDGDTIGFLCKTSKPVFTEVAERLRNEGFQVRFFHPRSELAERQTADLSLIVNKKTLPVALPGLRRARRAGTPLWNNLQATILFSSRLVGLRALSKAGFHTPAVSFEKPEGEYVAKGYYVWHDEPELNGEGDFYHELIPTEPVDYKYYAVDDGRVRDALVRFSGEHDFHNLTSDETGTTRDLTASATRDGDLLVVEVSAGGFPRALVRRIVGAVRAVGRGAADPSLIDRLLAPEPVPGERGVGPAPPEPLVLWDVRYEGVAFEADPEAAESARVAFGERYRDARHAAAATGAIRDRIAGTD